MSRRSLSFLAAAALTVVLAGCDTVQMHYLMNEGNKLYTAQKYDEAVATYQKVLRIAPDDWQANYQIAVSYLASYHPGSTHPKDLKYADDAIQALERLMKLKAPDEATVEKVRSYYVGLLSAANMTDKAISFYDGLLKQDPRNPVNAAQLAQLYAKKGDFPNALKYFEKRAEMEPANKEAWYTIGVVCWERSYRGGVTVSMEERQQLIDKGMAALKKALSLDPEYFEALSYVNLLYREQAKVLQASGNLEGAQKATADADAIVKKAVEIRKKQLAAKH